MIRRVLFILVGIAMIVAAFVNSARDRAFLDRAVSAKGVITAVWREWDSNDDEYDYYKRIRFSTEDGQTIELESGGSSQDAVGKTVQIYHDPDNPRNVFVGSRGFILFVPIAFGIFGLSMACVNIYLILRARRAAKRPANP